MIEREPPSHQLVQRDQLMDVPKDQLWFHGRDVQGRVARAEADFVAGRSARTETPDEAHQQFLDSLKAAPVEGLI
jgi:hypothetical protein